MPEVVRFRWMKRQEGRRPIRVYEASPEQVQRMPMYLPKVPVTGKGFAQRDTRVVMSKGERKL